MAGEDARAKPKAGGKSAIGHVVAEKAKRGKGSTEFFFLSFFLHWIPRAHFARVTVPRRRFFSFSFR